MNEKSGRQGEDSHQNVSEALYNLQSHLHKLHASFSLLAASLSAIPYLEVYIHIYIQSTSSVKNSDLCSILQRS